MAHLKKRILSVEDIKVREPSYLLKNNDRSRLKVLGLVFDKPADPMTSLPLIQQASLVKGFFESKQPLFVLQLQILEPLVGCNLHLKLLIQSQKPFV